MKRMTTDIKPRIHRRLSVEELEARVAPATFSVTITGDELDAAHGGVDPDTGLSLREAIIDANASAGADTVLLPGGMYTITRAGSGEDGGLTGDFDITEDLTIQGADPATTTVDAAGLEGRTGRDARRQAGDSHLAVGCGGLRPRRFEGQCVLCGKRRRQCQDDRRAA